MARDLGGAIASQRVRAKSRPHLGVSIKVYWLTTLSVRSVWSTPSHSAWSVCL